MEMFIESMTLLNFKGVRKYTVTFSHLTTLLGTNGAGKTTVEDAFFWLFIGKDSQNRENFEIKTLDENNEPYHHLSHEVSAVVRFDGVRTTVRKIYKEKWTKKKGSSAEELTGHTVEHFWNDVPLKESEFKAKVASYIPEERFKMLANTRYFNEVLKWEDRRRGLVLLAGGLEDIDVANEHNTGGQFDHLIKALNERKTVQEYRSQLVGQIYNIKKSILNLPARIDEATRALPEEQDYKKLEKELAALKKELTAIDATLTDQSTAERERQAAITAKVQEQADLKRRIVTLENEAHNSVLDEQQTRGNDIAGLKREHRHLCDQRNSLLTSFNQLSSELEGLNTRLAALRGQHTATVNKWDRVDAETWELDPAACICPTCKQNLPNLEEVKDTLQNNFNQDKSKRLAAITEEGRQINEQIAQVQKSIELKTIERTNKKLEGERIELKIEDKAKEIEIREEEHNRLTAAEDREIARKIETSEEIKAARAKIIELDAAMNDQNTPDHSTSEHRARKSAISERMTTIERLLTSKERRLEIQKRIGELETEERESTQRLASLEQLIFSLEQFDKAKMDMLEARVNGMFKTVSFKLFNRQVNGGESPTCIALINGVPYTDANLAARVNANLDIVEVFSRHFNMKVPVFIDNRESVIEIIDTDFQIINLRVSEAHPKLTVENHGRLLESESVATTLFS